MTPRKCDEHELRLGEFADSPRYTKALEESKTCWRCRLWVAVAYVLWRLR